ncbi:osteoglycin, paralog b [Oncorhynchus nerka]|uniref:osteoglycin, paralog b n=1 Tax=Oncorhynchus nerka TaxID=8023 RepID=UPI00113289DE|nr:mimecan-like [Oncorhynchus nerka]
MIDLRTLFFTIILVPWMLSSAARNGYMEARKPKKEVVTIPDYDTTGDSDTSPAAAPKDEGELPTCLLCVCLTGSVYCEEVSPEMTAVPSLPKETAYLYARYNKITKITNKDFADIATLRRIDLTGNLISEIEDGAFSKLALLEELNLSENKLAKLPMLPAKLISFNANYNQLKTKGIKSTAFKKLTKMAYLYLGNNELEAIPQLPESLHIVHLYNNKITTLSDETFCQGNNTQYIRANMEEVRLDGNPLMLAKHPNSFVCLRALPIGLYH